MGNFRITAILLLILSTVIMPLRAQDINGEDLEIRLFVVGQGDPVYSYWGHTGLAILDKRQGSDIFFDFGNFDFEKENFFTNFALGRLYYIAYATYTESYIRSVRANERNMTEYVLNLPPEKKAEMYRALIEKSKPENRTYLYHNYFDNCSTRIRDYIDIAIDGELKRQTEQRLSSSYRESYLRFTSHQKAVGSALSILQGTPIDGEISVWDEMFLPDVMGDVVSGFTYRDDSGNEIPLVKEIKIRNTVEKRKPVPANYRRPFIPALFSGFILLILILYANIRSRGGKRGLFAALNIISSLILGVQGSAIFFLMVFTDHTYAFNNLNLFMLNPLALILIPFSIMYGRKGGPWRKRMDILWLIQLCSTVLMIAIKALTPIHQDNLVEIMIFLPVIAAFSPVIPNFLSRLNLLRKFSDTPGKTGNRVGS